MTNEILLICSLIITYSLVLVFYRMFGKVGLFVWTAIVTIAANIEVLLLVDAFGMEQTLGNILFASSFLVTDILSENEDRKSANLAVKIGIMTNITFVLISQSWLLYSPADGDFVTPAIESIFTNTPRLMFVGLIVYATSQFIDVRIYHFIWEKTKSHFGDSKKGLWIRNNGSTLISQFINTLLFSFGAFYGVYELSTVLSITLTSYMIFFVTSLFDTPAVYISRHIKKQLEKI